MTGTYSHKQFNHISPAGRYTALQQRHNTENSKQIFSEKELCGLSPNFHIHVSVNNLYILIKYVDRSWEYICKLLTDTRMLKLERRPRAIPFLGKHKWDFRCSVQGLKFPFTGWRSGGRGRSRAWTGSCLQRSAPAWRQPVPAGYSSWPCNTEFQEVERPAVLRIHDIFWGESESGSGSEDPCLSLMDPDPDADPDPAIFVIDLLKMSTKKLIF